MVKITLEEWRDICGFEGAYQVSTLGRVRGLDRYVEFVSRRWGGLVRRFVRGKLLKGLKDSDGYLFMHLWHLGQPNTSKVHHLVLEAFIGPRPPNHECAHRDGSRSRNTTDNLTWVTHEENEAHKAQHGTRPRGEYHKNSKLCSADVLRVREACIFGAAPADLASAYGCHRATIHDAIKRNTWRHL